MQCPGRYRNGPDKRYVRCNLCKEIDWEANEGDRCKNENLTGEIQPTAGTCSCDSFCDDPCPQHGWTSFTCGWCKEPVGAPISPYHGTIVICRFCESIYECHEHAVHGWEMIHPPRKGRTVGHLISEAAENHLDKKYPVLDCGYVALIDYMGSDQRIAEAAWVSSMDEVTVEKKTDAERKRIINYMMAHRHTSPFEMVEFVFKVKLPIFVARQWIRHRTASVNEVSGRYRILPSEAYVPDVSRFGGKGSHNKQGTEGEIQAAVKSNIRQRMINDQDLAFESYAKYDQIGLSNEIARINLPLSTYTEWYWKIDLHNLFHFLKLRMDSHAQFEIQQYANKIFEIVRDVVPMATEAFEEYVLKSVTFSRTECDLLAILLTSRAHEISDGGLDEERPDMREITALSAKLDAVRQGQ